MPNKRKSSGRGYQPRRVGTREPLQRFLLVCEGEKTEPAYFDGFRMPSVTIEIVGLGKDPLALIDRAVDQRGKGQYDQVWCVFDRDDVPAERFNQALALARRKRIKVAYSNQAFELWYVLHFHYCDVAMTSQDYINSLSRELQRTYQKTDRTLYRELLARQEVAVQNAKRLLTLYNHSNPVADDPSTTVHLLVQELNLFLRR